MTLDKCSVTGEIEDGVERNTCPTAAVSTAFPGPLSLSTWTNWDVEGLDGVGVVAHGRSGEGGAEVARWRHCCLVERG